ncbi:hypothetical protein FJ651_10790 [Paucihalobacter ruber]|uniref:Uncharacterized protein n=1 Tax=Paucihalobacter ruber TaxID=2567861 RepID=A0A506PGT3_9FLAO|nr:DUF6090 family protein [Paucihalobacter ruber]TPV32794.1 hypothetical protein FJ651_10790 [Paucihalobacter ruber]
MIKLFRHFRQNLFNEGLSAGQAGKTTKYFKYAIGEILLVVIGILIALQINTWNNNRLNSIEEKKLLQNLTIDLNLELAAMENHQSMQQSMLDNCMSILENYNKNDGFLIDEELNKKMNQLWIRYGYTMNKATFSTMESTGKIDLIQNEFTRNQIVIYYRSLTAFSNNTQNNNSDLVDGLLNHNLIELSYFEEGLYNGKNLGAINFMNKKNYPIQNNDRLINQLKYKLSIDDNILKLINIVNLRMFLANIQMAYVEQQMEATHNLINIIKKDLE